MIERRFILATTLLAGLATACTAIVLGKVSDSEDYKVVPTGSSSSGSTLDECSLLKSVGSSGDHDANACSTCIEANCKADIDYACNKERKPIQKDWFGEMQSCAQKPWNGYAPPPESNSWSCKLYATPKPPISDNGSDSQREPEAHNCINTKCMQGALPDCKRCEVHIKKTSSQDDVLLRDDPCGKCLVETCPALLVECCDTAPMDDFVQYCAFTKDTANKDKCLALGTTPADAGTVKSYDDAGTQCFKKLAACFNAGCSQCKP